MKIDWTRNETLVFLVVVAFCVLTTAVDPAFLSLPTLFDLLRNSIVTGIFAIGVLLVLISGGIDVSFTAIAAFAMYTTTLTLVNLGIDVPWYGIFALSILIGTGLGLVNAVFIAGFRLPTLIVTLGTLSAFRGFLLTFVGSQLISNVPAGMRDFSRLTMLRGTTSEGYFYSLPWAFVALVLVVAGTWFLLNKTLLGRKIFAIGGSAESQICCLRRVSRETVSRTCFSASTISSPGVRIAFSQASTARSGPPGNVLPGAAGNNTAMPSIGSSGRSPLALPCQGLSRPASTNSKALAGRETISGSTISSRSTAPPAPFCVDSRKFRLRRWMA